MKALISIPILAACVVSIAGCPLDALERPSEPSEFQRSVELRQLITLPAKEPEIVQVAATVKPVCTITYRVNKCSETGDIIDW